MSSFAQILCTGEAIRKFRDSVAAAEGMTAREYVLVMLVSFFFFFWVEWLSLTLLRTFALIVLVGKTMIWMLWAVYQAMLPRKEKMVVICPLVAIKEEFFAKAQEFLIPSHYWESGNDLPTSDDILIFLSVEEIPKKDFQAWLTANAYAAVSCTG